MLPKRSAKILHLHANVALKDLAYYRSYAVHFINEGFLLQLEKSFGISRNSEEIFQRFFTKGKNFRFPL